MASDYVILVPLAVFAAFAWTGATVLVLAAGLHFIKKQSWYLEFKGLSAGIAWILLVSGTSLSLFLMLIVWLSGESFD